MMNNPKGMFNLAQKIEEYTEELFVDLGLTLLPEEQKADIFARVEERFRQALLDSFREFAPAEITKLEHALSQENPETLEEVLSKFPQRRQDIENKIDSELDKLKLIIAEEQKDAGQNQSGGAAGGGEAARI